MQPPSMNLASYLRLLNWTARLPADVADILTRLGSSPDLWQFRLERLKNTSQLSGVAFATKRLGREEMATARVVSKLANVSSDGR